MEDSVEERGPSTVDVTRFSGKGLKATKDAQKKRFDMMKLMDMLDMLGKKLDTGRNNGGLHTEPRDGFVGRPRYVLAEVPSRGISIAWTDIILNDEEQGP